MKEEIILDFKVEQGEAIAELEQTKVAIINLKKEQKDLNDQYKKGAISTEQYAKSSVKLEGELKKQTTSYNENLKAAKGVETQFDKLISSNKKLTDEVKKNTDSTKLNVESIDVQGQSLEGIGKKFSGVAGAIAATTAILAGLAKAYISSAAGARDLSSAQAQLSASTTFLSNKLAKLVGADGKGGGLLSAMAFQLNLALFGIDTATQGVVIATAKLALEDLELVELEAQRAAKNLLDFAEVNRQIRDDTTKGFQERKRAAENVGIFVDDRERQLIEVQEKRLAQLNILLSQDEHNLELKKQIKQVEFEIADIQEDSQGKRTEALNGINNLLKEQAEIQRQAAEETSERERMARIASVQFEVETEQQKADQIISIREGLAEKSMDLANKTLKESIKATEKETAEKKKQAEIQKLIEAAKFDAVSNIFRQGAQLAKDGTVLAKALGVASATVDTYKAANLALATYPPPLGGILAGVNIATGLANVTKIIGITAAAGGGSFETRGPQLMVVGDNPGGRERVDVTPLSGRGQTRVGGGMIQMAGGGSLVANSSSSRIDSSIGNFMKGMNISVSWREGQELGEKINFKERLVTL